MGAGAVTANYRFDEKTVCTPVKGKLIDTWKYKIWVNCRKRGKNRCKFINISGSKVIAKDNDIAGRSGKER